MQICSLRMLFVLILYTSTPMPSYCTPITGPMISGSSLLTLLCAACAGYKHRNFTSYEAFIQKYPDYTARNEPLNKLLEEGLTLAAEYWKKQPGYRHLPK